ncbi:MAG TPA: CBS domain-containing protein, partial [Actinomycetota bacterium]|nr:CBS domain-containing protein [Actinomycetota bacterium]
MEETAEDDAARLSDLIAKDQLPRALEMLDSRRPADAADLLESLDDDLLARLVDEWSLTAAAEVLEELDPERRAALAERIPAHKLADILETMPPDEAADFLGEVDPHRRAGLIGRMERDEASDVAELFDYPEDSAGRRMSQDFVAVGEELSADAVIERLREVPEDIELIYYVYVLGGSEQLKGVVSLRKLLTAPSITTVGSLMETDVVSIRPNDDVEAVVDLVRRYDLLALPVTDDLGRMLGIITVDDVLEAMEEESEQDVLRFAGSINDQAQAITAWPTFRRRLPWLAISTLIELLIAYLLLRPLPRELMAATVAYIPLLIFLGGNAAIQAAARVLVRLQGPRTEAWSAWKQARRELEAGALLGV